VTDVVTLLAHHALITAIPFVLPAFLVVGAVFVLKAIERRRDTHPE
jgi:hypothetical protein